MEMVKELSELKNINCIDWSLKGDDIMKPEMIGIRFTDDSGKYWEICTYSICDNETENKYKDYVSGLILNAIFHSLGLLKNKWIGVNCSITEAVNEARKMYRI